MSNKLEGSLPNLIGVSGRIAAGKDEVTKMIQEITAGAYENRKFAGKLKDIVCLLIGCTREDLEDREFKETPLSKDWNKYTIDIESISTDKEYVSPQQAAEDILFYKHEMTPRILLQQLGTNAGRKIIHQDIWINALFADYKEKLGYGWIPTPNDPDNYNMATPAEPEYPKWVISDVRFPGEVKAIEDRGGIVIRVERPCLECGGYSRDVDCDICTPIGAHLSETALDDYDFKYVLDNGGDLIDLKNNLRDLLGLEVFNGKFDKDEEDNKIDNSISLESPE